jgi:hypothetical protein
MAGVRDLLKRSFDYKRIKAKIGYTPMLLLDYVLGRSSS